MLAVLIAPRCAACDLLLDHPTGGAVCAACWASIRPMTPPLCDGCGMALPSWRTVSLERALCPRCRRRPRSVDRAMAIGEYEGTLRAIVHALKYDGRPSLARPLAARMRTSGAALLPDVDFVIPVPLHPKRRRERGFNQAEELARHLDLPVVRALVRVRATAPQATLPSSQRHANVRQAFRLARRCSATHLHERTVLLVDDVSTTGATLDACARVLKNAGAREVRGLTAAVVPMRRP